MTFEEYIRNPMGIANSVISNREMYKKLYTDKLDKILLREVGKLEYYCMKESKGSNSKDVYWCYLKIPSENVSDFYYDVIIKLIPKKGALESYSIKEYDVQFFSNDPSFVFTFAHAFIKNKMFIPEYLDKMSKEAVQKKAEVKNPHNQVGYVKSLYFAYLIMDQRGLFHKMRYNDTYNENAVKRKVMNASKKIKLRQEATEDLKYSKRKVQAQVRDTIKSGNLKQVAKDANKQYKLDKIKTTINTTISKSTKISNSVKKSKSTKRS